MLTLAQTLDRARTRLKTPDEVAKLRVVRLNLMLPATDPVSDSL